MMGAHGWSSLPHVSVGGVRVSIASRADLTAAMVADCLAARAGTARTRLIFDSNGHAISLAAADSGYRRALDEADVIHADGGVVVLVSRLLSGEAIRERSATTDLIHDFAKAAEDHDLSFYLLGGTEKVNSDCAERLRSLYPRLRLAGRRHGYFDQEEEGRLVGEIAETAPDILWVGLGKPLEQLFAAKYRDKLKATWVVTCGGCYNYITGDYSRAPLWMQNWNLEWLHRAATEPRKLLWRYLTTSPHALWLAATRADKNIYISANGSGAAEKAGR